MTRSFFARTGVTGLMLFLVSPAWACPLCNTGTGQQVCARLFKGHFGFNLLLVFLPFSYFRWDCPAYILWTALQQSSGFSFSALQGGCPPLPLPLRLGVQTQKEVDREKYTLKALRGDFDELDQSRTVLYAIRKPAVDTAGGSEDNN